MTRVHMWPGPGQSNSLSRWERELGALPVMPKNVSGICTSKEISNDVDVLLVITVDFALAALPAHDQVTFDHTAEDSDAYTGCLSIHGHCGARVH